MLEKKNQQSKKKPFYKKVWFWVIVIIIVLVGASQASNNEPTKVSDKSSSGSNTEKTNDSKSDSSSGAEDLKNKEFKVGDVISYDGKELSVTKVERNWSTGNEYIQPSSGKEYVRVTVKINNKSDDTINYGEFDWQMKDSSGDIKDTTYLSNDDGTELGSGEIAKGGSKTGSVVFEVPAGDKGLTLLYKSEFWNDTTVNIKF